MKRIYKTFFLCLLATVIFNISFVSATIFLHETSHFLAGIYLGCEEIKIVLIDYPKLSTYSEIRCPQNTPVFFLAITPLVLVTPFAVLFLLLKNLPEKHFCWVIIGFNITIGASDILKIVPTFLFFSSIVLGIVLIIFGQILFINQFLLLFYKEKTLNGRSNI